MSAKHITTLERDIKVQAIETPVSLEIIIYDKMDTNCTNSAEQIEKNHTNTDIGTQEPHQSEATTMTSKIAPERYLAQRITTARDPNTNTSSSTTTTTTVVRQCKSRVTVPKKTKGVFNSTIISLAFISYAISNQMATLILSTNELNSLSGDGNSGNQVKVHSHKLAPFERSIVSMVAASPSPDPSPAKSRSAPGRMPPMNGSIFGKRSLDSHVKPTTTKETSSEELKHRNGAMVNEAVSYNDIITEVIENFMSNNNNGDPSETTVAFCRVIVYECNQLLNHRRTSLTNSRAKTLYKY